MESTKKITLILHNVGVMFGVSMLIGLHGHPDGADHASGGRQLWTRSLNAGATSNSAWSKSGSFVITLN